MEARAKTLPINGYYDKQRFPQFNPADCANWYLVPNKDGKDDIAMYPAMGRRHINYLGINRLIFSSEPRFLGKSNNFVYVVDVNTVYRIDKFYNQVPIGTLNSFNGYVDMDFLVVSNVQGQPSITFVGFVDGQNIYIYWEEMGSFQVITDSNAPANPTYIISFGNRFAVSGGNTSQFNLSAINLGGSLFNPATAWSDSTGKAIFAQEAGIIKGFEVLHNLLYIFCEFTTGIWSNVPSIIQNTEGGTATTFPWKKNTSNDWSYGLSDASSLDVGFDRISFVGQNKDGILQIINSYGDPPKPISSTAISVLFQEKTTTGNLSPFLTSPKNGFLYSYEDTIFYRLSAGSYSDTLLLEAEDVGNAIEYNFNTGTWHRVIEKNGQRNRIQKHVFFNNVHLVTLFNDTTVYEMSGEFYDNELSNPVRVSPQDANAYLREPFRYERVIPIEYEKDYSEFLTEYVQIEFVWGDRTFIQTTAPFPNAEFLIDEVTGSDGQPQFLIAEGAGPDGQPVYILAENGNFPEADSLTYNNWFKPHIELLWSDDGGISFQSADVREFSQLGVYNWRMRWYQLGTSRNRTYKLICVSPSPIVVLGAYAMVRRASGGAN